MYDMEQARQLIGNRSKVDMGKNDRFNALNEARKQKREDLIMKRRGLNFITEHHEELLDQSTISACESQLDNVAPKIVGLLGLGPTVDLG